MATSSAIWTWPTISRTLGVAISVVVLIVWAFSTLTNRPLDPAVPLALLGLATLLFTGPSGLQLIVRRKTGNGSNGES